MTQPSRLFSLWQRLYTRFSIEPVPASQSSSPSIATMIQPITDADALVTDWRAVTVSSQSINAGLAGTFNMLTPSPGTRVKIFGYHIDRSSGDNQIDLVNAFDRTENASVAIDEFTAAADRKFLFPGVPLILEENDLLTIHTDGTGVGASVFRMRAWLGLEQAY